MTTRTAHAETPAPSFDNRYEHHASYFDPKAARDLWEQATREDLKAVAAKFRPEALEAYKVFWYEVMERDAFSAEQRSMIFFADPLVEEMKPIHDLRLVNQAFEERWQSFPGGRMTWEDWKAAEFATSCPANGSIYDQDSLFRCLPIPEWRTERSVELNDAMLRRGERFRKAWKSGPCPSIMTVGKEGGISDELDQVWQDYRCELLFVLTRDKHADVTQSEVDRLDRRSFRKFTGRK